MTSCNDPGRESAERHPEAEPRAFANKVRE
jgi:hypothetical protein